MTRARIWAASVFVDYDSGYVHVGLQTDQSGKSTLQAKQDFEHLAATQGVKIEACITPIMDDSPNAVSQTM